jgi:hypothetical protein
MSAEPVTALPGKIADTGPADPGEPLYYAKDGQVWQRPVRHRDGDTTHISLGFPICSMTEAAGNGAADIVAALMNGGQECVNEAGRELIAALEPLRKVADEYSDREDDAHQIFIDEISERRVRITLGQCRAARAAIAKAQGRAA